ncbi:NAD(P)/FAD-dependent oxidoreductase [Clostridium botulinum]|uniref:Pyridine nucleotide-disulphide oxidoreductase family protein n=1 Tax=Clostridium botulinum (strain Langeland / NCTC 10281 / Type F) TaxID=441772 RepID=A7GJK9_CLOBL|nr:NAD(P)/FAD-dependent oxidoreductase [Clostridium botulinum]ABS41827.1 pyridine nucleotide-disulphide oxidoreductase family protein [Clostridium botulinum F str. Langeland]ADG01323.1 pyridine nucleotide-disulfide oxidoreductase family protein [Clostridium botulinum F str. 230613]KKM43955.1 flavoprotein [Clostridium botulinum]MBY6794189.1 NAD(P)/FAD-dependent oxidoreductase [Clostridium botulinum]MBY6939286.1 NAD(P)/FAD-dependent oxidoreductase [Clostridium botulinum]
MYHEIIILGGGASGITASIISKDMGTDVAILESNDRIGKKILTTGNGRCNISNENISSCKYYSNNNNFYKFTLSQFTVQDTKNFFNSLGLPLITLNEGKIYPMSLQASSVLDILRLAIEDRQIPIYFNNKVKNIKKSNKGFVISTENEIFQCKKLILASGGMSAPNTGSDGSGFKLAKNFGHNIIDPIPGLVQLKLDFPYLKALSGIKFDGNVKLTLDNKNLREESGEILFTDYGISGPPILQLSSLVSRLLYNNKKIYLEIDMFPNMSKENIINLLENHWGTFYYRTIHDSFIGIINKKLIPTLLKYCGIKNIHMPCQDITWQEKERIFHALKNWIFTITGTNSFKNSQVTCGGVDTSEVSNKSLESLKVKDLYFCGEILDVNGDCGGFNLQWAWSSGYIAGKNASSK